MTVLALYQATPHVDLDGQPSAALEAALVSLSVREELDGVQTCEATFHNAGPRGGGVGYQFFDTSVLDFGRSIAFEAGAGDGAGTVFAGKITGIRGAFAAAGIPRVAVTADDALQDLRLTRRTRVFETVSDADVVRRVAADHGLTADVNLSGPTHRAVTQLEQTDLAFLRTRVRRAGAELWVDDTTLHVESRTDRRAQPVILSYRQNLREADLEADLAHQQTEVVVAGWDPGSKEAIEASAGAQAIASERAAGRAGAELLASAFGDRVDRRVALSPASLAEARSIAEAAFRRQARRFVRGALRAEGDARLQVGAQVELTGLGPWFSGAYDVVCAHHVYDLRTGYETILDVERAELGS